MDWIKNLGLNILLIGVSSFVALLCVEGILRFTSFSKLLPYEGVPQHYYTKSRGAGYDISKSFASSTHRFKDGSYTIWSNEFGCFDVPYHGEKEYSLLVGDSFAWGFTAFPDKWGTQLETLLGERILKCGVPGYGTRQELAKAESVLSVHKKPTRIILSYFSNDEGDDASFPNSLVHEGKLIKNLSNDPALSYDELESRLPQFAKWAEEYCMWNMPAHPALQRVKCYLRRHSIVYLLSQSGIKNIIPMDFLKRLGVVNEEPAVAAVATVGNGAHFGNVVAFNSLAGTYGSKLLVVLIPSREDTYSTATTSSYKEIKEALDKERIPFIDPRDDFRRIAVATSSPLYWKEDLHLNEKGNHLLGYLVARYIAETQGDAQLVKTVFDRMSREFGM